MKTTKIFMMAALAMMFAACSNEDNELFAPEQGELIPFKATIRIDNGKASNRALSEDLSGLTATWAKNDHVALATNGNIYEMEVSSVEGGVATITGSITSYSGAPAHIIYPYDACKNAAGQIKDDYLYNQTGGTLADVASNYDVRTGTGTIKVESGFASLDGVVSVTNQNAIFKFTTKNADGSATIAMTSLTAYIGTNTYTITPTTASSEIYAALPAVSGQAVSFTASDSEGKKYIFSKSGVTFAASNYYKSTLKMTQGVDLSTITEDYTAQNGDLLTGKLNYRELGIESNKVVNVSIADGATVTLLNVDINGEGDFEAKDATYDAPGLTLLGGANIIQLGTNKVQSYYNTKPGIYVPNGKSLTILGSGSLEAKCKEVGSVYAAGIGAAQNQDCGDISIYGGTITAIGYSGIGAARDGNCGNIYIYDSNVTATGIFGAGIGGANRGTCKTINIYDETTIINATGGDGAGIGSGDFGSCEDITINNGTVTATGKTGIGGATSASCGNITINGGNITANGRDYSTGAGIGAGYNSSCGTITITGGTVTAKGSSDAAGIGAGYVDLPGEYHCGKITISGGTVTATGGSSGGAGIGAGVGSTNGTNTYISTVKGVEITSGITSVTATKGSDAAQCIGAGYYGRCDGSITIGGTIYWDGVYHQNEGATYLSASPLEYRP